MDAYDRNGGAEAMELGPNRYDEPKVHECIVEGCYEPMLTGYEACTKHALEWAREEHVADPFDNGLWENYCELLGIARAEGLAV